MKTRMILAVVIALLAHLSDGCVSQKRAHLEPEAVVPAVDVQELVAEGVGYYESGNYDLAAERFYSIAENAPDPRLRRLALAEAGLSYYLNSNLSGAQEMFSRFQEECEDERIILKEESIFLSLAQAVRGLPIDRIPPELRGIIDERR